MTDLQKISYSLGINIAQSMKQQGIVDIDATEFAQGMNDFLKETTLKIPEKEILEVLNTYFKSLQEKKFAKNIEEAKTFFAANKDKKGVITLPSGLQYEVIKMGDGAKPKDTDKVTTHYHGTLLNGNVFDSSVSRGQPATFPVNGVIKGWTEALQIMPVGSKWRLYIPSDLAYGAHPQPGGPIEPHMALIFDIELLKIA